MVTKDRMMDGPAIVSSLIHTNANPTTLLVEAMKISSLVQG